MQLDKVILFGTDLARIDSSFALTRSTFAKQATIIFTNGKSDPRWRGAAADTLGSTFPSMIEVNEATRTCSGTCLVDLLATLTYGRTPAWTLRGRTVPAQASPAGFRYWTVKTIVHELQHIMQGWQIGKRHGADVSEESVSAKNRSADDAKATPQMENTAHRQNAFELGALDFENRWMALHVDEVHAGKFDFMLPMTTMRGVFPEVRGVYRKAR